MKVTVKPSTYNQKAIVRTNYGKQRIPVKPHRKKISSNKWGLRKSFRIDKMKHNGMWM